MKKILLSNQYLLVLMIYLHLSRAFKIIPINESEASNSLTTIYTSKTSTIIMLQCPDGWIYFDDRCYFYEKSVLTHKQAKSSCQAKGGRLAIITSQEQIDFLRLNYNRLTSLIHVILYLKTLSDIIALILSYYVTYRLMLEKLNLENSFGQTVLNYFIMIPNGVKVT